MKIMIVDDNEKFRKIVKNTLDLPGAEFYECEDGGQSISQYSQVFPDWVLMDVSMDYVDGITAIEELTAMFPESKIIILTHYEDVDLRSKATEYGARAYVLKEHLRDVRTIIVNSGDNLGGKGEITGDKR